MGMLEDLGWDEGWAQALRALDDPGLVPGRVAVAHRRGYDLLGVEDAARRAEVRGRLRREAGHDATAVPVVGDWVAVRVEAHRAVVEHLLPRRTLVRRRAAGRSDGVGERPQAVAANVDVVFAVTAADADFSVRRAERYLAAIHDSGARPVLVLSKAELTDQRDTMAAELRAVAGDAPVVVVSAREGWGLGELRVHLPAGPPILTAALVGSSGVGKSTLANALLGADLLAVGDIRVTDGKGRHTTTRRELLPIPGGGLLLDTPGMREFGLWGEGVGPVETFTDVEEIAQGCRFRDCAHAREPACAVRDAIAAGLLTPARVESWRKLRRETRRR